MPTGANPPKGIVASGTLTVLQSMATTYNSLVKCITSSSTNYYLGVERGSSDDQVRWFYCTAAEAGTNNNPYCKLSQTTFNVVHGGTYNSNNATFTFNSNTYELRLELISGVLYATAVQI